MISNGEHKHTHFFLIIILLVLISGVVSYKFIRAKHAWNAYSLQAQTVILNQPSLSSSEQALVIATTISTIPAKTPMYKTPTQLKEYVAVLSRQMHRDLVVIDVNKMILADTVSANIGTKYQGDTANEVTYTITDKQIRTFKETSVDYPDGVSEVSVPITDSSGQSIGSVILSATHISN